MNSIVFYIEIIIKTLLRLYRKKNIEFRLRPRIGDPAFLNIDIIARKSNFRTHVKLRKNSSDLLTFIQVFINNGYDMRLLRRSDEINQMYQKILEESSVPLILDIGANIGLASLYFTKNWPQAHIIGIEPEKENYRLFCQNVEGHQNIQPVNAAISHEDGIVKIINPESNVNAYRTERTALIEADTIEAKSVQSLMSLAPPNQTYKPFIAKIDIEGFEKDLFSGNTEWIALFPIIIIELHDWFLTKQATSNNFLRTIAQYDRDFVYIGENIFSIANN